MFTLVIISAAILFVVIWIATRKNKNPGGQQKKFRRNSKIDLESQDERAALYKQLFKSPFPDKKTKLAPPADLNKKKKSNKYFGYWHPSNPKSPNNPPDFIHKIE